MNIKDKIIKRLSKKFPKFEMRIDSVRKKRNQKDTYKFFLMLYHRKKGGIGGYFEDYELKI